MLTAQQPLQAYRVALLSAIAHVGQSRRRPKDFDAEAFSRAVASLLTQAKVSQLSRATALRRLAARSA